MTEQEILVHLKGADSKPEIQCVLHILNNIMLGAMTDVGKPDNEDRDFSCGVQSGLMDMQQTLLSYIAGEAPYQQIQQPHEFHKTNPQQSETNTENEGNT